MVTEHPGPGYLFVKPDYKQTPNRPDFVQVTVAYLPKFVSMFTNKQLQKDIMEGARTQLAPDFKVFANYELVKGRPTFFFTISDAR